MGTVEGFGRFKEDERCLGLSRGAPPYGQVWGA